MDSITQAALGGLCGELTLRKQLGWKGLAWGIFFGTLPDLDILVYPWLEPMDRLSWHRGISHSILACFVAAFVFGWLLAKIHRRRGVSFKQASGFVFVTWLTHILIDCFNSYGTQILEPFSSHRVAFNNMSIVDLLFMIPILLGLLAVLFHNKQSRRRTTIGRVVAVWLCLYTTASLVIKHQANKHFEGLLAARGIEPTRMMTSPTLNNIFLWRMVAETDGQFHISYWSFFDPPKRTPQINSTPKGHEALEPFNDYPETKRLIWFAQNWHKIIPDPDNPGAVLFVDLRFSEMVTPTNKKPVFVWRLSAGSGKLTFHPVSYRDKKSLRAGLAYQWQRLQGGAPEWMQGTWPWEKPSS